MGQGHVLVDAVEERCILVGVISGSTTEAQAEEYLDELQFLALTAGAISEKRFVQKLQFPNPKTYVGSGKLEEIRKYVESNSIDLVIIDDELSPSQARNIEKVLGVLILDRNNLILDIFASRARTASAKTQVELAQMQYLLPRLTNLWTHLDRQKGGIGMRGPGETEIETDRRIIQQKIALLKSKLKAIDKQKKVQRGNRGQLVRVALVGYTNVGKSTIMNMLSKSDVFAENKLFATLDTTVRKVVIENLPFLLADTVGFIRKLPHQLVDSFKSTLDEVRESDLLVHVLDISHVNFEDQYEVVKKTLAEIDTDGKPTVVVFNKIDAYNYVEKEDDDMTPMEPFNYSLDDLKKTWMNKLEDAHCVFISAQKKKNIEELKKVIYGEVKSIFQERYPYHHFLY
ncbi:GTPase HflX [Crocinitomicaceae bacterium]|nr:GTPase HflX [Crocinitomicaceae bacterium]